MLKNKKIKLEFVQATPTILCALAAGMFLGLGITFSTVNDFISVTGYKQGIMTTSILFLLSVSGLCYCIYYSAKHRQRE